MDRSDPRPADLFTARDVARFCQVDLKTIHNWADRGEIRHFRTPGRHLRFRRADVVDFLRKFGYPVPDALRSGRTRVLVVDEDAASLAAVRRAIGRRCDVATFAEALDALVAFAAIAPDIVVLPADAAGIDVARLVERLRSNEATAHVRFVLTGGGEAARDRAAGAAGRTLLARGDVAALRDEIERLAGSDRGA